ncbi:MAG: hypothetical protein AAGF11_00400 [Myxococcota bacterium]
MTDYALIDGDIAEFMPGFGMAIVSVQPGTLVGSGPATYQSKALCVDGDERTVSVPGCMYLAPPFIIPGTGTLEIASLAGDQVATKSNSGDKPILLVGSQFVARFRVEAPAMFPFPPVPDPTPEYSGQGRFTTTNTKLRAT